MTRAWQIWTQLLKFGCKIDGYKRLWNSSFSRIFKTWLIMRIKCPELFQIESQLAIIIRLNSAIFAIEYFISSKWVQNSKFAFYLVDIIGTKIFFDEFDANYICDNEIKWAIIARTKTFWVWYYFQVWSWILKYQVAAIWWRNLLNFIPLFRIRYYFLKIIQSC